MTNYCLRVAHLVGMSFFARHNTRDLCIAWDPKVTGIGPMPSSAITFYIPQAPLFDLTSQPHHHANMTISQSLQMPYKGLRRKLLIAFDVGTTFSGVSYTLLIPGEPPHIYSVTKFPNQHKICGDSKIPTVVCYDEIGRVVAVGSETDVDTNPDLLDVTNLVRTEWFKLHFRPAHLVDEQGANVKAILPLPPTKTVVAIFGDFLKYLYRSTKQYIRERQGNDTWDSISNNIDFILSHPNGWEGRQQSGMRHAAVIAGLVSNESEALERISFVTEGEASLHFCLRQIPMALDNHPNDGLLVVDCGGGTIDISAYARSSNGFFREIAAAECLLQGSFFVTQRAQKYLTGKLAGSQFGRPGDIDIMTKYFDKTTKPSFKGSSKPSFIRFGRNENEPQFDIRSGSVKICGSQVAEFFDPAVKRIIQAIEGQCRTSSVPIKAVFMVGGFAHSEYLFSELNEHFRMRDIEILRPDAYLNKAVAEGAILYKINHLVTSRVSKYTYGIESHKMFNPANPDHAYRASKCTEWPSGDIWVPSAFSCILPKDSEVSEDKQFRKPYFKEYDENKFRKLSTISVDVLCYRDRISKVPAWIDQDPDLFPNLCTVTADVSEVKKLIHHKTNKKTGRAYYELRFDVILLFGLTELQAQIAWKENGIERRGQASIVYDIDLTA